MVKVTRTLDNAQKFFGRPGPFSHEVLEVGVGLFGRLLVPPTPPQPRVQVLSLFQASRLHLEVRDRFKHLVEQEVQLVVVPANSNLHMFMLDLDLFI